MHKIRWMLAITMLIVGCGGDGSSSSSGGTAVAPPAPASKLVLLADFNGDGNEDMAVVDKAQPAGQQVTSVVWQDPGAGTYGELPTSAVSNDVLNAALAWDSQPNS